VRRLCRIAWWNWPDAQVFWNVDWFYRPIAEFIEHFDPDGGSAVGGGGPVDR